MPVTPDELYAVLRTLEIDYQLHQHPPLHTVAESRELRGEIPGAHCKSLFLKDHKGKLYLVVCLEHRRLDMKRLTTQIGAGKLSFGRAELLAEVLGVQPGAVTPFALWNDREAQRVRVALDAEMMQTEFLNYHPLHNEATVTISRESFERFLAACGHPLTRLEFGEAPSMEERSHGHHD